MNCGTHASLADRSGFGTAAAIHGNTIQQCPLPSLTGVCVSSDHFRDVASSTAEQGGQSKAERWEIRWNKAVSVWKRMNFSQSAGVCLHVYFLTSFIQCLLVFFRLVVSDLCMCMNNHSFPGSTVLPACHVMSFFLFLFLSLTPFFTPPPTSPHATTSPGLQLPSFPARSP